jgi:archaellum component FlaD/FlaE
LSFKNLTLLAIISAVFGGCSGCSEDSIPDGSGSRSSFNLDTKVPENETSEERGKRIEAEEYSEEVSEKAASEMNDLYEKLREKSRSEKVHEERVDGFDSEDSEVASSNNDEVSNNRPVEQKKADQTPNSWDALNEQVKEHMEDNRKNYPTPPKPANLSIYDDVDRSTVYESDGKTTSSAIGEFPPMPPMMMLEKPQ